MTTDVNCYLCTTENSIPMSDDWRSDQTLIFSENIMPIKIGLLKKILSGKSVDSKIIKPES